MKTYKYKLKLNKEQSERVNSWIGASRYIYNLALETKIEAYNRKKVSLNKFDLMKQLVDLKDVEWIKDVPAQSLQNVIERMDFAYQSFFKGGGFPKWAKRNEYKSILLKSVKQNEKGFTLPKLGFVKIFKDRMPSGALKTSTIIKENNSYYFELHRFCESQNLEKILRHLACMY